MDPDTLEGKIHISGFTDEEIANKVSTSPFYVSAGVTFAASHAYTVTFDPGAKDQYGQVMGGYVFSFTTGALPSTTAFALPSYMGATFSASAEPFLWYWTTNKPAVDLRIG